MLKNVSSEKLPPKLLMTNNETANPKLLIDEGRSSTKIAKTTPYHISAKNFKQK
jgi:hypothetical protein